MMNWPASDLEIINAIIDREGGFVNDPVDSGGATNFGITIATYAAFKGHPVTPADVENMPRAVAVAIYQKRYLTDPGFDAINNMHIRSIVVDTGVLFGPVRATQFLQQAVGCAPSGALGPATLAAVNGFTDARGLCNSIAVQRIKYHVDRVVLNVSQLRFLRGWVSRATSFIE